MTIETADAESVELTSEDIALIESPIMGVQTIEPEGTAEVKDDAVDDGAGDGEPAGGKDAASEANKDAPAGSVETNESPFAAEDIERAKALGIEEEELADFSSARALKRHLDLAEKLEAALAGSQVKPGENPAEPVSPWGDTSEGADELLNIGLYDGTAEGYEGEGFDDRSLAIAKAVRREQELRIATQQKLDSVEQFVSQLQQERIVNQFSDVVDSLENPTLGTARDSRGRLVDLTKEQLEARTKLFAEVDKVAGEQQKAGKSGLTWEETIAEAGKRIGLGRAKPSKAEALRQQSASRRPVSSGSASARAPQRAKDAGPLSVDDLAEDPELEAWWQQNVGR